MIFFLQQIKSYFPEQTTIIFRVFNPNNFPRPDASDTAIATYGVEEVAELSTKLLKNVEPYVGKVFSLISKVFMNCFYQQPTISILNLVTAHWSAMVRAIVKSADFCLMVKSDARSFWSKILSDKTGIYMAGATTSDPSNHLSLLIRRVLGNVEYLLLVYKWVKNYCYPF